jgi:hypothetical protein
MLKMFLRRSAPRPPARHVLQFRVLLGRAGRPEGLADDKQIIRTFTEASGHQAAIGELKAKF